MYRPENRSPEVQQKLRVSNAPTIGQARRMSKAHGNNYCESAEQRTANRRGTESPARGSDVELGRRNGRPMSNDPPSTNPGGGEGAAIKAEGNASKGQTERERTSQVEEECKDQRRRRTPEAKSSRRHDRRSNGRIANARYIISLSCISILINNSSYSFTLIERHEHLNPYTYVTRDRLTRTTFFFWMIGINSFLYRISF